MLGELSHVAVIVCHDQLHHRGDGENIIVQDVTPMATHNAEIAEIEDAIGCIRRSCPILASSLP